MPVIKKVFSPEGAQQNEYLWPDYFSNLMQKM